MIEVYNIHNKVSDALRGSAFVHSMPYQRPLGYQSGSIIDIHGMSMDGKFMGHISAKITAAYRFTWAEFQSIDWLHEMDLKLKRPKSITYYRNWWGRLSEDQEILVFLLTPQKQASPALMAQAAEPSVPGS